MTHGGSLPIPATATHAEPSAFGDRRHGYRRVTDKEESRMLAAIGLGLVGTILVIVLVIAAIMFFMRRA
jgi:hypothetical protein